jgi:signal transduction histidine kinase
MFGLAIIMASALGVVGARQLAKPIVGLKDAALSVAEGDYGLRLGATGGGEVAELTRAFNFMSSRLASDREKIATKNREIEAFNQDLQAKVVERTAALEEAHERLLESSRMAAVAQMGAGLAHELNNPVAGILGLSQVGAIKGPEERIEYLRKIEVEALRCREVLRLLARFSSGERSLRQATEIGEFFSEVLSLIKSNLLDGQVEAENGILAGITVELDRPLMAQALTQLFLSLRTELLPGGTIVLESGVEAGEVVIAIRMVGEQRPRGDDWLASGMGFWVARYAMQEHGGALVESTDDSDTMYELHFTERDVG